MYLTVYVMYQYIYWQMFTFFSLTRNSAAADVFAYSFYSYVDVFF